MNFADLKYASSLRVEASGGWPPTVLAELLFKDLLELERWRAERLAKRPERKPEPRVDGGRPGEVKPFHKVLRTLLHLRQRPSQSRLSVFRIGC